MQKSRRCLWFICPWFHPITRASQLDARKATASHQLAAISVFRTLENKVYLARCANTEISCIIDPYRRIVDRVKDEKDQDIFVQGCWLNLSFPLTQKLFTPLETPAARSRDDGCSFFGEHGL
jgi:hypothetical protein